MRVRLQRRNPDDAAEFTEEWSSVTARARSDMEVRRRSLEPLADVVASVSAVLFREDPVGLAAEHGEEEYDSEAETIVLRLSIEHRMLAKQDVLAIVHEEFIYWFGTDIAGSEELYESTAGNIFGIWSDYLASGK